MNGRRERVSVRTRSHGLVAGIALLLLISACSTGESASPDLTLADAYLTYDPVAAGEPLPTGYRQLLDRDQIAPIYNPMFTTRSEVDWPSDMLVIGVAGAESAKAYPVTHLNQREMVIDSLEGIPILVSW